MNDDWKGEATIRDVKRSRQSSPASRQNFKADHLPAKNCATPGCSSLLYPGTKHCSWCARRMALGKAPTGPRQRVPQN